MADGPLEGLSVLDLSEGIAGPYCTRLLGGFGAEVIKVERPGAGDRSRTEGPFPEDIPHPERSALFLHLNVNKKGITLNLETGAGREVARQLAERADVLVESFEPDIMTQWGLDYEDLERRSPGLVMASITPFGQTGPYRHYQWSSAVLDALGGNTAIQGDPAREPIRNIDGAGEYTAGMFACVAVFGALFASADAGQGQHIDISIQECLAEMDSFRTAAWTHMGQLRHRTGGRYAAWPGKVYRCRDGHVGIAGVGPTGTLLPMYSVMGIPELLDPKYETYAQRVGREEELDAIIQPWLLEHDRWDIFNALQRARVQAGVCNSAEDLLGDPGFEARGFWVELDHPEAGKLAYPGPFTLMSDAAWQMSRAPLLGEHNEQVYRGLLGYSSEDLTRLRERGVV